MKDILSQALHSATHPAVASMECFKLLTSMEQAADEERQAAATVKLLESISELSDTDKADELLGHVAELQGVEREHVSLESLSGLLPVLRKLITPEKEPSKSPKDFKELQALFNKYYLNSAWLSKQTLVDGEVDGASIGETLSRRGKFNAGTFAADLSKYAGELKSTYSKYVRSIAPYAEKIRTLDGQLVSQVNALNAKDNDYDAQLIKLVKDAVAKMEALEAPVVQMDGKFEAFGGWTTIAKNGTLTATLTHKGPTLKTVAALTKEDIVSVCKTILELYATIAELGNLAPEFCDLTDRDHGFVSSLKGESKKLWEQYVLQTSTFEQMRRLLWMTGVATGVSEVARVSIKWIDRSIRTE